MRRKIFLVILMMIVMLGGCGNSTKSKVEDTERKISNIYETEDIKNIGRDNISFNIPKSWEIGAVVKEDWTYYYFDESMLATNISEKEFNNDSFISEKDEFIKGMVGSNGDELVSSEVLEISGQKVLEVEVLKKVNGEDYILKSINFAYNNELYTLGFMIKESSNIDYSKDYEAFKNSIEIVNHEETDESGYPTSWKLLSDLRKVNNNISCIEVFNNDTDPNGIKMGSEGYYITKASFLDYRLEEYFWDTGTIETFRTEEDCLKRTEYLRSINSLANQYIYPNGKSLFRVSKELSEIQAEEYNNQLVEIINGYEGNESENTNTEEAEIVDKLEWKYDENNHYTVGIFKDKETGKEKISAFGNYEEQNKGIMQNDFMLIWANAYGSGIDISYAGTVGEETYFYLMSNGKVVMNTIPTDEIEGIPENYSSSVKDMTKELDNFYVKNGLKEKTYNDLIYEDEKVKISFAGISENGVVFWVENLTDVNITIQADSVSINGISSNKIMMSDDVAPKSKGKIVAKCDDFSEGTKVETVGGQLTIIDFGESFDSYKATFVNVPIE